MTQGKLPQRGWVTRGMHLRIVLFRACLERCKLRRHELTPQALEYAESAVRDALSRYAERRLGAPYVTATEQSRRLGAIAVAARRLAAAPANQKWRNRLEEAISPLFLSDPSTGDFVNHVLVEYELTLGLPKPRGLPQFVHTLQQDEPLDAQDLGRCRVLATVMARRWGPGTKHPYLPRREEGTFPDPHAPDVRDAHLVTLVRDLEGAWRQLTGRGVLAQDPIDKRVYFADWLALVVRKATRGRFRILPGTIIQASEAFKKSKLNAV